MKYCFLLTLACTFPAMGQMMYNPPATGGTPAPASPQPANPSGSIQPNAYQPGSQGDAKSLFGNELPFLNPQVHGNHQRADPEHGQLPGN